MAQLCTNSWCQPRVGGGAWPKWTNGEYATVRHICRKKTPQTSRPVGWAYRTTFIATKAADEQTSGEHLFPVVRMWAGQHFEAAHRRIFTPDVIMSQHVCISQPRASRYVHTHTHTIASADVTHNIIFSINKMLSKEDRVLITFLRVGKRYGARRIVTEFSGRNWSRASGQTIKLTAAVFVIWIFGWFYLEFSF